MLQESKVFTQTLYLISSWELIQGRSRRCFQVPSSAWLFADETVGREKPTIIITFRLHVGPGSWILGLFSLPDTLATYAALCYLSIGQPTTFALHSCRPSPPPPASGAAEALALTGAEEGSTAALSLWLCSPPTYRTPLFPSWIMEEGNTFIFDQPAAPWLRPLSLASAAGPKVSEHSPSYSLPYPNPVSPPHPHVIVSAGFFEVGRVLVS